MHGLCYVVACFGGALEEQGPVAGELEGLLVGYLTKGLLVHLVTQDQEDGSGAALLPDLAHPAVQALEAGPVSDVVDHDRTDGRTIIGPRDSPELV